MSLEESISGLIADHVAAAEQRLRAEFIELSVMFDRTLSVSEAANHLGVSEKLLYRLCTSKSIPHERYGVPGSKRPTIKFRLSDLERWRSEQRATNSGGVNTK